MTLSPKSRLQPNVTIDSEHVDVKLRCLSLASDSQEKFKEGWVDTSNWPGLHVSLHRDQGFNAGQIRLQPLVPAYKEKLSRPVKVCLRVLEKTRNVLTNRARTGDQFEPDWDALGVRVKGKGDFLAWFGIDLLRGTCSLYYDDSLIDAAIFENNFGKYWALDCRQSTSFSKQKRYEKKGRMSDEDWSQESILSTLGVEDSALSKYTTAFQLDVIEARSNMVIKCKPCNGQSSLYWAWRAHMEEAAFDVCEETGYCLYSNSSSA